MKRDILTPTIVIGGIVLAIFFLWAVMANGQTHTFPGNNVFPSTSTTDFNAGATVDFTGATVTGFAAGGTGTVTSITATTPIIVTPSPLIATGVISLDATSKSNWDTAFSQVRQWDGGATGLTAATGRTSLALDIGVNVQAYDADLTAWAAKTTYAGNVTITTGKTFNCTGNLTLSGTDGSTLNMGGGGTLGTAAYTASTAYQTADADLTAWAAKTTYAGDVTITTGKTFNCTGTLTLAGTDGSTLNVGAGGTLGTAAYTASTAYQAADSDLTAWAGVTAAANVGTFLATPSSANLRGAVTDENGTGALLFSGATAPDFTTGFTIGAAAASGKIPIGNGTNYVPSTPTYPNASGAVGYTIRSDATNFASYPQDIINTSVASQSPSTSDVYVTGSNCVVSAGDMKAKGQYRCLFDVTKSAGTGGIVISVRTGTAGTTSDTAQITFTFPAGTSVADVGTFEVIANWRTVGSGSSAVISGFCRAQKNTVTAAGLWNDTSAAKTIVATVSGGFNSSTHTNIGVSFNGGTAFAGTITTVQATLMQ